MTQPTTTLCGPSEIEWSCWPCVLQEYARRECLYGDRKIEAKEAEYVMSSLFRKGDTLVQGGGMRLQFLGSMFRLFGADATVCDSSARWIIERTGWETDAVQKILNESIKSSPLAEIKQVCGDIVSKQGQVLEAVSKLS